MKDHVWIYTVFWTLILSLSVFAGPIFNCDSTSITGDNALKGCILPMIFIACIYLWEEIWNILHYYESNTVIDIIQSVISTLLFLMLAFLTMSFALLCAHLECKVWFFFFVAISWYFISVLKFISVNITKIKPKNQMILLSKMNKIQPSA